MDSLSNALISAAAANVSGHGFVDVFVGRLGRLSQQLRRGHDLPGLAIAALRHIERDPSLTQRTADIRREAFNSRDFFPSRLRHRSDARANRLAIEMDRAGA